MAARKRYAIVGTGGRSSMYSHALLGRFKEVGELVALCDINPVRMAYYNAQFAEKFGAAAPVAHEIFSDDLLRRANELSFGVAQLPTFDLGNAGYVIGFGADFLGTWNAPVAHAAAYGHMRRGRPGVRGAFVQVEARMTQTGANADTWLAVRPGTEGALILGLAHVVLATGTVPASRAGRAGAAIADWSAGLPAFSPDAVAAITGLSAARITQLAGDLLDLQPALVIAGAGDNDAAVGAEAEKTLKILLSELSVKQAAALAAKITGVKKNLLYDLALSLQQVKD